VKPFVGFTFKGDTTFVTLNSVGAVDKNIALGVGMVWLGEVLGLEGEVAHLPHFFETGDSTLADETGVTTYSGSVMVAMPRELARYTLRPYGIGGLGLMRVTAGDVLNIFSRSFNQTAFNVGGGATGFLTERVGLNWELRYFRSLTSEPEGFSFGPGRLSYWRATMAVAIR
jgi:opacity protein-like surface antigen